MTKLKAIFYSFIASALGYLVALFCIGILLFTDGGDLRGFDFFVVWTALLTLPGWLFFFVPIVLSKPINSNLFSSRAFLALGTLIAGLAYVLFTTLLAGGFAVAPLFLAIACVVGGVAGYSYSLLIRPFRNSLRESISH